MSRHTKQQYEDVARLLAEEAHFQRTSGRPEGLSAEGAVINLKHAFADLFAADNPDYDYCGYCGGGLDATATCPSRGEREHHSFAHHKGFNREQFITACGLKPVRPATHTVPKQVLEYYGLEAKGDS